MSVLRLYRVKLTLPMLIFLFVAGLPPTSWPTPLDDYVAAPDSHYTYNHISTIAELGYSAYILEMTSQQWRTGSEVDRTIWQHWLIIIKPTLAFGSKGLLIIDGGSNGGSPPLTVDQDLITAALLTNSVIAQLKMVPNQPLLFSDETVPRSEDEIIAYSFDKYFTTSDDTWPVLLPMVKSAVRAMDAVHDFILDQTGFVSVNQFAVTGGSKRAWTAWLTAAVDPRVISIIPIVFDALNLDEQMVHHLAAYGFYSPAIQDYVDLNIMDRLDTAPGQALLTIVDPYQYRDRYAALPKYMINSTGDQFFLPDSTQFYFHDLPGEKHLRYVPNTDHGISDPDAANSIVRFYSAILDNQTRPQYSWTIQSDHSIRVETVDPPTAVNLWQADSSDTRDFRLETIGPTWSSSNLTDQGGGVYIGQVPEPDVGWRGFFVELIYDWGGLAPFKFTTEVYVIPDTLPHARRADYDYDGDVDQEDFGAFQLCLSGGGRQYQTGCMWADLDKDDDVDQTDVDKFQGCMSGANILYALGCEDS
ncbi:MAG: PhoPQ-activated pathogenicity-related family protein [Planctomycetota bacterium]|nr:MAG: PhoPQ-activated pathogenicity-related family protein [Planctomycetota bacterium]